MWLLSGLEFSFRTQKFEKMTKMGIPKNGLRSAVAIYMAGIWPFLGFGGWNVRFLDLEAEACDPTQSAQTSVLGPKNLSRSSKWLTSEMVSDRPKFISFAIQPSFFRCPSRTLSKESGHAIKKSVIFGKKACPRPK